MLLMLYIVTPATMTATLLLLFACYSLTLLTYCHAQAETIEPLLPFGDINVLVLTDTHSWVAGHGRQEEYDADYGDVLSFYERLKAYSNDEGKDLWFVMNGDFVDGTGLSEPDDVSSLVPILEKMPWDAINCEECKCKTAQKCVRIVAFIFLSS
jgi:2',3'-cyclic-nucleotide 2'-phosphodiesterase (5'-nucleotidase family)